MLLIGAMILGIGGCRGGSRSRPTAISGKVTFDGKPLANAQIRLYARQNDAIYDTKFATQTDAGGNYRFAGLMPGVFCAEVSKRGEGAPIPDYDARQGRLQFTIPETPIDQSLTQNFVLVGVRLPVPGPGKPVPPVVKIVPKFSQMIYLVEGAKAPDQQPARVREVLGAVRRIVPGSIEVSPTEIRFRVSRGSNLDGVNSGLQKLGYQVKNTTSTALP